jgi:hypothetical protein
MKTRLAILMLCLLPVLARANPVKLNEQSLLAFGVVAFWALVIESGIATLAVVSSGLLILPLFGTLIAASGALFLFGFLLTGRVSLWVLEPGVVLADMLLLKLAASAPFLQGDEFVGVAWRRALMASLLGNAASFFVGVIGSGKPWIVDEVGALG